MYVVMWKGKGEYLMSLKKGYRLTPFGRWSTCEEKNEKYGKRLTAEELKDFALLKKRALGSLTMDEFQRVLDHMVKAGIIEEVYF
jgi:hypothetical protein